LDEYLCITLQSRPGESAADFKARLSAFWTHMLRNHEANFKKVYAETSAFERKDDCLTRKYLVEAAAADAVVEQLRVKLMGFSPIDADDVYSKYEAAPPEWFWIEH
jgi:hypothetical protein